MKLRRFNTEGIEEFRTFLQRCRDHTVSEMPSSLLEQDAVTEVVVPGIEIAPQHFDTKGEAAHYLKTVLSPLDSEEVIRDAGLWTWLATFFFDSVCVQRDGGWLVYNDYRYIYEPKSSRNYYRHLTFISWHVLGIARGYHRLILQSRLSTYDVVTVDVMKRLFLTRIPCMFEVLDRLYWDDKRGRPRAGITGSKVKGGDISHRLPLRIRQLERTYDLMSLNADQLIELLGEEFAFARPRSRRLFEEVAAGG